jgi:hypothetical protein
LGPSHKHKSLSFISVTGPSTALDGHSHQTRNPATPPNIQAARPSPTAEATATDRYYDPLYSIFNTAVAAYGDLSSPLLVHRICMPHQITGVRVGGYENRWATEGCLSGADWPCVALTSDNVMGWVTMIMTRRMVMMTVPMRRRRRRRRRMVMMRRRRMISLTLAPGTLLHGEQSTGPTPARLAYFVDRNPAFPLYQAWQGSRSTYIGCRLRLQTHGTAHYP